MVSILNRSTMAFLSDPSCHYSQRVRIVLAEKGVTCDIESYTPETVPAELADHNPYNSLPTLLDRDVVLYETRVIMEYLDERFPHPSLLSVYPVERAQARQLLCRIEKDWSPRVDRMMSGKGTAHDPKVLVQGLVGVAPVFDRYEFFLNEEFGLADCCLAPILWRLEAMNLSIRPTRQSRPLLEYMQRIFDRPSFQASLTPQERAMRSN